MGVLKKIGFGLSLTILTASCSVQQFAINTSIKPFEKGGKVWGERTQKHGKNGWKAIFKKDNDLHLLGINIKTSNVEKMVKDLNASSYTIETKSNLIVQILTFGIVDYKIVKVIKREN
jgi:hypothetical protein